MPEGKSISYAEGEYPQLDGLQPGDKVKLMIDATIQENGNDQRSLVFENVEIETDNQADREMKSMSKQNYVGASQSSSQKMGDDF